MPPTDNNELHLLTYRVQEMENKIGDVGKLIVDKIDALSAKYDDVLETHITHKVIIHTQGQEIVSLKALVVELQKDAVAIKLSMAERLAIGFGGGTAGAVLIQGIIELLKLMVH